MTGARNPRYSRFVLAGAVTGAVVGFVIAELRHPGGDFSAGQVVVYTCLVLGLLGGLTGGVVAAVLDRPEPRPVGASAVDPVREPRTDPAAVQRETRPAP